VFFTSDYGITHTYEDRIYSESYKMKNYDVFQDENETIYLNLKNEDLIETESNSHSHYSNEK